MAEADVEHIIKGYGSDERPLAHVLWARDRHDPDHPALTGTSDFLPQKRAIDYRTYYDRAWAQAEAETVWAKSWLFACREEDIPEPGDRVSLDVGEVSYFIVRTKADGFKAFFNSCLHRGTKLCAGHGSGPTIRCPYHAWEWNIDGRLKHIPSHWDFSEITRLNGSLPEVKLDRWGGFIFINADPNAGPLAEALGVLPEHFRGFAPEQRYTAARFRKLVRANWKIAQEAFQEAYHLYATHPEAVPFNGDSQTQYDVWPGEHGHIGRNASCSATPSMHAPADATVEAAALMFVQAMHDWHYSDGPLPTIDTGADIRAQLGDWHRAEIKRSFGWESDLPDAALMDSFLYFMFPHAAFWMTESLPFTYQFLPHPTEVEQCYFEVRMLHPCPPGEPRPPSAPAVEIGPDESVLEMAPAFGFLGYVFDQDMSNMPLIQQGIHAANPTASHSRLGRYQEKVIQHWNNVIVEMVANR